MDPFAKKTAVVLGGASGIGKAVAEELAARGAVVTVADVNGEGAEQVAASIRGRGGQAQAQRSDVTREDDVCALVEGAATTHQRLDYVLNTVGMALGGDMRDVQLEHWRRIVDINLWGTIYVMTAAYRIMVRQGSGHIVNTASAAGLVPMPTSTPYSATKHAVVGMSLSWRYEAAPLGVRVSVVCPGYVQTGIWQTLPVVTPLSASREEVLRPPMGIKLMDPRRAALTILTGVARNRAVIAFPAHTRILWWLYRLNPALLDPIGNTLVDDLRRRSAPRV